MPSLFAVYTFLAFVHLLILLWATPKSWNVPFSHAKQCLIFFLYVLNVRKLGTCLSFWNSYFWMALQTQMYKKSFVMCWEWGLVPKQLPWKGIAKVAFKNQFNPLSPELFLNHINSYNILSQIDLLKTAGCLVGCSESLQQSALLPA